MLLDIIVGQGREQESIMARPSTGANLNIAQLEQILHGRKSALNKLMKQRRSAQTKVDEIDRQIERIGGAEPSMAGAAAECTVRNERSLADVIEEIMRKNGKPIGVGPLTEAVRATGYRSSSPHSAPSSIRL